MTRPATELALVALVLVTVAAAARALGSDRTARRRLLAMLGSPAGRQSRGSRAGRPRRDAGAEPVQIVRMLEALGRRILQPGRRPAERTAARAAGRPAGGARGAALALGAAGALAGALGPAPLAGCPLLAAAGYRLPDVAARLRVRASRRALDAALPETADLLAVSMNAGLNVPLGLRRVALHAPEPLRSELDRVNGEIALGRPLRDALAALADRAGTDEMRALVSILTGAGRFGSRVGDSLERWSDDLWTRRKHQVEAEARRAPVKILFPLVFLILPAFLLTTVVPLLLSTLRTLGY